MWGSVVAAVSVVIGGALVAWFFLTPKHPEAGSSHTDEYPDTLSERFYGPNPSGPAGPDAEEQNPEDPGNAWDPPPPRFVRGADGST